MKFPFFGKSAPTSGDLPPANKYFGLVHGFTTYTPQGSPAYQTDGWWVLTEVDGERRADSVGNPGTSPLATHSHAEVVAWLSGGPLPALGFRTDRAKRQTPPPKKKPSTRKPK